MTDEPGTWHFACSSRAVPLGSHDDAEIVVLRVAGELDLLSMAGFEAALNEGLRVGARHLVIDLSGVTFCGARAFTVLADTARAAAASETECAVSGLSPHLVRVAAILWQREGPTRYRTAAAAVTAIRAARARHDGLGLGLGGSPGAEPG